MYFESHIAKSAPGIAMASNARIAGPTVRFALKDSKQ
jgi:hypothetical protein